MNLSRDYQVEVLQDRFALKVAARLSDGSEDLPHDISERLRHGRIQALARRKAAPAAASVAVLAGARLAMLGGQEENAHLWWRRLGSVLALVALIGGLKWIGITQDDIAARELANVDADLLVDDLPPAAYTDPGFGQFLRVSRAQGQ